MDTIRFFATSILPNPKEVDYWVDLSDNPYGGSIKYYNGTEWVRLAASGGAPDLSNYYTKVQVNKLLNDKADITNVDSKVDDEEVKDVINNIQFNAADPNETTMVVFRYDGSSNSVSIPVASVGTAGIVTSADFINFVKLHQLLELHTEMIDLLADIRAKYQKKLVAGLNIVIDLDTNVISASGDLSAQWDKILNKPDFKAVATSGDYNDLINKLKAGKDVNISDDNTITIDIDSDELNTSLSDLDTRLTLEATTARAAEKKLQDNLDAAETALEGAIATEKNRAETAESTIATNLLNEITRSTNMDVTHTNAIALEVQDRKDAITTEVNDRNSAILVETNRAKAEESKLDGKITDHTTSVNAALALKADKSDTYTKAQVDAKLSGAYKVKGSSTFENLPTENNVVGDVYNITNAFTLDGDHFDPGTNVVWTDTGWDALSGSFDTTAIEGSIQDVADDLAQEILDRTQADTTISGDVTALGNRMTTAEGKLNVINSDENTTGSISKALKDAKGYTDTKVTTEKDRAEAAEQLIAGDLDAEITRAKGAESANTTAIQNEVKRATGIEAALRTDVDNLADTKVDKVEGKGLSTNDYTTPEKEKLAGIEANANNYTLPTATDTVLGGVKTGANITNTSGTISLTKANVTNALGVDPTTTYVKKAGDTMSGPLTVNSSLSCTSIELHEVNPYIDFHFNKSSADYTSRLAEFLSGVLSVNDVKLSGGNVSAGKLISTTATGTAPIRVSSTTLCTNLNADMLDGYNADLVSGSGRNNLLLTDINHLLVLPNVNTSIANISILASNSPSKRDVQVCTFSGTGTMSGIYMISNISTLKKGTYTFSFFIKGSSNRNFNSVGIQDYSLTNINVTTEWQYIINTFTITEDKYGAIIFIAYTNASSNSISNYTVYLADFQLVEGVVGNYTYQPNVTYSDIDWYGVSWSENSPNPDCTRIGNMDMHRTLPILSMMRPYAIHTLNNLKDTYVPLKEDFVNGCYSHNENGSVSLVNDQVNIMIKIPEFWYFDDYIPNTKTHNLKICAHSKPGWYHHKEAFVSAYEGWNSGAAYVSNKGKIPTVNVTRTTLRSLVRANGFEGESKWNIYTYEEHRAICHLFLVEYATRHCQKAVNNSLTPEGFRQGGLGAGCTTGAATINGLTAYSFIPTGSSDSLGSGSGEVTVTIQLTDASGNKTTTVTRLCNRYRGIENPFGHIWKHTDDVISVYANSYRTWYKSMKPDKFATNKNASYKPLTTRKPVDGWKKEIACTPTCDFFAEAVSGSETTYWCDYNYDNTDASEHCLLIGGRSVDGGWAGLFYLYSSDGVGDSYASIGSRLVYLPWAE